jgi:hypothetical protein
MTTATVRRPYVSSLQVPEAASVLGVQESRFRSAWRAAGIVRPGQHGGTDFHIVREDLIRAAVLVSLQAVLGEQNPLPVRLVKQLSNAQLETLLETDDPRITVQHDNRDTLVVGLDPDYLAQVREGLELPYSRR